MAPPMRAPDAVRNSPLGWRTGPFAADGWVEADRQSLRHRRYPEVFAVGDVAGVAALVTLLFGWMLVRQRGLAAARLARSELVGLAGAVVAVLIMQAVTHSGFADIGGPIDWVLVALIAAAGFVAATMIAHVGFGLLALRRAAALNGVPAGGADPRPV